MVEATEVDEFDALDKRLNADAEPDLTDAGGDKHDASADSPAWSIFSQVHPVGWVGLCAIVAALLGHLLFDTDRLVGDMAIWQWVLLLLVTALGFFPPALNAVRAGIESIADLSMKMVWILGWAVFIVQLINVLARYLNPLFEADILIGQMTSLAWQLFGVIALVGLPYGVKYAVNPRIDFWWADWSLRKKAWLDFIMHTFFFLPFLFTMLLTLRLDAAYSLGKKRGNGTWPDGWRVWDSWEISPDADQLPLGPIKALIFVGFFLFALQIFAEIVKSGFVLMGDRKRGQVSTGDEFQRIE